jgi:hypothetical protein
MTSQRRSEKALKCAASPVRWGWQARPPLAAARRLDRTLTGAQKSGSCMSSSLQIVISRSLRCLACTSSRVASRLVGELAGSYAPRGRRSSWLATMANALLGPNVYPHMVTSSNGLASARAGPCVARNIAGGGGAVPGAPQLRPAERPYTCARARTLLGSMTKPASYTSLTMGG